MNSIVKEITIIALLVILISIILVLVFYSYIPINKIVPSQVEAYTTSSTIKNEIDEDIVEYPKETVTFEITDSDLTLYKQTQSYNQGKADPFSENSVASNSVDTNSNSINKSNNTFFKDTNLK